MLLSSIALALAACLVTTADFAAAQKTPTEEISTIGQAGSRMDPYEVTNRQMAAFLNEMGNPRIRGMKLIEMGSSHSLIVTSDDGFRPKQGFADHPVVEVSFEGARAYCGWAGKRLPTEAEWHQVCSGPEAWTYPWGNRFDPTDPGSRKLANLQGDADGFARTAPVGLYPTGRNPSGIWDLGGNVWEWTFGPEGKPILRGGSWSNSHLFARCKMRDDPSSSHSFYKGSSVGFRCMEQTR